MLRRLSLFISGGVFLYFSGVANAIDPQELRYIINSPFYDPNSINCSSADGLEGSVQGRDVYSSGLQGPYILEQFMIHVLKRLSQKYNLPESNFVTQEHTIALVAFAMGEGGDIMNRSIFNPMNLGYKDDDVAPVSYAAGGIDGRQAYPSFDQGVEAYARQMSKGNQSRLGYTLSQANSTAENFMYALTYYREYSGNSFWASASISNPSQYYNSRLDLIKSVRSNYSKTAALVIGTEAYEQREGIYNTDLIYYKDLLNGESRVTVGDSFTPNPCIGRGGTSTTLGLSIAEVANREYNENKGILEYGGDILTYTDGNSESWCASFVSWVYKDAGAAFTDGVSGGWRHPGVLELREYMRKNHIYFDVGAQSPQPGDIAFYVGRETADNGSTQHVNIVYSVNTSDNTMVTIGGNESDQIRKTSQSIALGEESLVGFGRFKNAQ